ncbi:MAG: porin family protein [Salinibacter sp.]|jgi:hypothetical protein|uniref:porin family protein n=1 Tax=Salinibacter sp. TaxID=2065818 RepID=UPI002FC28A5A
MRSVVALLTLTALLLGVAPSHAQEERQFGLTLGMNRVTMQSSAALDGYFVAVGGVMVRQPLAGSLSAQAELLLNQKGARVDGDEGGAIDYGVGYLELPLLLHLKAPSVRSVTVHGEAGGFGAVKIFERQTPGGGDVNVSFDGGTSFYRRTDAGLVAGVGAALPIGGSRLNLTVRRAWGLQDVARDVTEQPFSRAPFPSDGETRTWSLLLRLGF